MCISKRIFLSLLAFAAVGASFVSYRHFFSPPGFEYFTVHCSIFNRTGEIIFNFPNYPLCAFNTDGKVLASAPGIDTVAMYDVNDQLLWKSHENAHHDLKFSKNGDSILLITTEVVRFGKLEVRSDCFSVRDLGNRIKHKWCMADHINQLNEKGIYVYRMGKANPADRTEIAKVSDEISHANSIYEITENARSGYDPAFAAGNYLVHLNRPTCALLILDRELKNILWSKNFCRLAPDLSIIEAYTHDNQITPEGHILSYVNFLGLDYPNLKPYPEINNIDPLLKSLPSAFDFKLLLQPDIGFFSCLQEGENWYSQIIEFDPYTDRVYRRYVDSPPENFRSELVGGVTKLNNGNYLYSDITHGGQAFEVNRAGKKIWTFELPQKDNHNGSVKIRSIKPLLDTSFLKVRNLK